MESWSFRDTVVGYISKWYLILIAIILGGLLGMVISYLLPAPYQATGDIYVGIDVTRVNEMEFLIPLAKAEPLNLDDYKNWQLKQVAAILASDDVLSRTLNALGKTESISSFKKGLDLYWFDAGVWKLEVVQKDKDLASAAVEAWMVEGHKKIEELLEFSEITAALDAQLFALADEIGSLKSRSSKLMSFMDKAEEWTRVFADQDQTQPLSADLLVELNAWILVHRKNDEHWQVPVGNFPQPEGPVADYSTWLENASLLAGEELEAAQSQLAILEGEREKVLPDYHQALEDSLGLSANLVLQPLSSEVEVIKLRSTGDAVLGGGILGLLAWTVFFIINNSKNGKGND